MCVLVGYGAGFQGPQSDCVSDLALGDQMGPLRPRGLRSRERTHTQTKTLTHFFLQTHMHIHIPSPVLVTVVSYSNVI